MVLDIGQREGPTPKCYFTHATLPAHIDGAHPPVNKEPFWTILEQPYSHQMSLLMPSSASKQQDFGTLQYAHVYMKPLDLITGDFFNSYIKSGDIAMLSEGRSGTDTVFSLSEGILRIEVDKPTYEKLGLEGKAVGSEGRKHIKARFAIESDLRLPSMLPGKPGFGRLIWAFKNVLNNTLSWLFYDLRSPNLNGEATNVLSAYAPTFKSVESQPLSIHSALLPSFTFQTEGDCAGEIQRDAATELLEWLNLAMARCPSVLKGDDGLDPYLCRYRPETCQQPTDLVLYQWRGFAPSAFVQTVLLAAMKASRDDGWFALGCTASSGEGYMVLRDGGEVSSWRYSD